MCVYYICIHCMYTYWVHTYLDARIHTVKLCGYLHMVHVISLCVCGGGITFILKMFHIDV